MKNSNCDNDVMVSKNVQNDNVMIENVLNGFASTAMRTTQQNNTNADFRFIAETHKNDAAMPCDERNVT